MSNRRIPFLAVVLAATMVAAACSGGDPVLVEEETADPAPVDEATVDDETENVAPAEAEAEPTGPVEPLTGLPLEDPALLDQPAVAIKIDNAPEARPQVGINQADQVVEVLVEGITRLVAVFHSTGSDPVGPIRSGRSSDPDLVANYGSPLYAWSGGNATVRTEIRNAEVAGKLYDVGVDQSPADYYREGPPRAAPWNLFSSTTSLLALQPDDATGPPQIFEYRADGEELPAAASPTPGIRIVYRGGLEVIYAWDEARAGWVRFQRGTPHVDGDGVVVAPANVLVLITSYRASSADSISPQALTVGEGEALTLTAGSGITGRWERADPLTPWSLLDAEGQPVRLTPGRTWIALPEAGDVSVLTDAEAQALLATAG